MGFRFHKSVSLLPGLRLNFSKSGPSVSVGQKGLTWNIGGKRDRATVGLPGSGLSYSTSRKRAPGSSWARWIIAAAVAYWLVTTALKHPEVRNVLSSLTGQ